MRKGAPKQEPTLVPSGPVGHDLTRPGVARLGRRSVGTGRRLLVATSRASKKPRLERRWSHPPKLSRKTAGSREKAPIEYPSLAITRRGW